MKYLGLILILLWGCSEGRDAQPPNFIKKIYNLDIKEDSLLFVEWREHNFSEEANFSLSCSKDYIPDSLKMLDCFWEDNTFIVLGFCMGEFGGALFFIDKENPKDIYAAQATCPIFVEKRLNSYFITESIAHLQGFSRIKAIDDPRSLNKVKPESLSKYWMNDVVKMDNTGDAKPLDGIERTIIDTTNLLFHIFFNFDDNNYIIYSKCRGTFLGRLEKDSVVVLDTILQTPSWSYEEYTGHIINGVYHYKFKNWYNSDQKFQRLTKTSGEIFIKADTIVAGISISGD